LGRLDATATGQVDAASVGIGRMRAYASLKRGSNEGFSVVRFGGDGTGQSQGRYRFAFNTVIVAPGSGAAVFRLFTALESVEMHSNVFAMRGGGRAEA